jgi:hypothetical protein
MDSITAFLGAYRDIYHTDDGLTPDAASANSAV